MTASDRVVRAVLFLTASLVLAPLPAPAAGELPPGASPFVIEGVTAAGGPRRDLHGWLEDGVIYVGVNDLSKLMGIPIHWRAELGKLTLDFTDHNVWVMDGSDFAVVDGDEVIHLPGPAYLWRGEMAVPLDLLVSESGAPRPWTPSDLVFDRDRRLLSFAEREFGVLTEVMIDEDPMGWKLILRNNGYARTRVVRAEAASFVIRIEGIQFDPLMFTVPTDHPSFGGLRLRSVPGGLEASFSPPSHAVGYRLGSTPERTELLIGTDERDLREGTLERFTASREPLPEAIYRIALDPAHGGRGGTSAAHEGRLAEQLCWKLSSRLLDRFGIEVVFTRDSDESPNPETRAERANRARADLLLSFHLPPGTHGVAAVVAESHEAETPPEGLRSLGFKSFYGTNNRQLPASRVLARSLMNAVAERTGVPSLGVFEEPVTELQAVSMPAVLLEIGMGGHDFTDDDLAAIVDGVVEGIQLFLVLAEESR